MLFFQQLDRFGARPAFIDAESGVSVTYAELERLVSSRCNQLPSKRSLIFIEARNEIPSLVSYLACLRCQHVVHLLESVTDEKAQALIEAYEPNLIITADQDMRAVSGSFPELHRELRLLLSTSGSTGTPKFVKLSVANIQSNAESIAEYLQIDNEERAYLQLKPFYSYGLSVIHSHLVAGAALILSSRSITEPEFLQQLGGHKATSFAGVPYAFETLLRLKLKLEEFVHLRTLTQAGGKLEPHIVADYARRCQALGKRFIVMYGQTEAAPRISYLPAHFAERYPASIGKAIPGGKLFLVDDARQPILTSNKPGELAYSGPNVMMGYATSREQLASDETPEFLYTGDIAFKNEDDLFCIVGRTSRFVKMFGLRINLDQIQSDVKREYANVAVAGDDKRICIALSQEDAGSVKGLEKILAKRYHLPESCFVLRIYQEIPLLSSGKYDFKQIGADSNRPQKQNIFIKFVRAIAEVLELNDKYWPSITEMYRVLLANQNLGEGDSFDSLGADSLSYVALSIEMEEALLDALPVDWRKMSLSDLDSLYVSRRVST